MALHLTILEYRRQLRIELDVVNSRLDVSMLWSFGSI